MISIPFEKTDGTYTLRDAIVLKENHTLTEAEIEAIKQQRFDNWIAILTAPPVEAPVVDVAPIVEETPIIDNTQVV